MVRRFEDLTGQTAERVPAADRALAADPRFPEVREAFKAVCDRYLRATDPGGAR